MSFDRVSCDIALEIIRRQRVRDRLPRLLPEGAVVARKTGSVWGVRNDIGIRSAFRIQVPNHRQSRGKKRTSQSGEVRFAVLTRGRWRKNGQRSESSIFVC